MRPLPVVMPDADRRFVIRVAQQPYVRVDRNDYSLDPRLAGRRVEVCVSQQRGDRGRPGHRRGGAAGIAACSPAGSSSPTPPTSRRLERLRGQRRDRHVEVESSARSPATTR